MTAISLRALTKIFGAFAAVQALDLEIADGEFFSFLGPSGCGKTTTLRMIAGLERPTGGGVWFAGREVTEVPPQHRNVGLVFQSYAVFPTMTVFENVAYGLRVRRVSPAEIRRRVTSFLRRLSLDAFASRLPHQLSGGQLQRVALARALVIEPDVLLLDEPLSNLDAKLRVDVRAEIKRLQRDLGITTLYVTHDQEEALTLSDRLGVMHQGRLEQVGDPAEIYRRPATRFVAGFVGEGTLIDVDVSRAGDGWRARADGGFAVVLPAGAMREAGPGWLCIRPEAVRLVPESASQETFPAVIEHVEFAGPVVRADLRVDGLPGRLRATRPATDVVGPLTPGDAVRVTLDAAAIAAGRREGIPR